MVKICPNCGIKTYNHETHCMNCGNQIENNFENFNQPLQSTMSQNEPNYGGYQQPDTSPEPTPLPISNNVPMNKPNKKPLIALIAISVVAIVIIASAFILFTTGDNESDGDKISFNSSSFKTSTDGPVINLQSLASGNLQSIPAEGYTAKYCLYYNDEKCGEITTKNTGITTYNGVSCYKIIADETIEMNVMGYTMAMNMDITYYVKSSNMMPLHMSLHMSYSEPQELSGYNMESLFDWDHETGEMTSTISMMGQEITMNSDLSQSYWDFTNFDDMTIGETKTFDYTMSMDIPGMGEQTATVEMSITLTGIEDITIENKTYENCYVIETVQTQTTSATDQSTVNSEMKLWVTPDGIVPKSETTSSSVGSSVEMTMLLEEYTQI